MKKRSSFFAAFLLFTAFLSPNLSHADEIYFQNGDRLTGRILGEDRNHMRVDVSGIGVINIDRTVIEKAITQIEIDLAKAKEEASEAEKKKGFNWNAEISGGFDRRRGNTNTDEINGEVKFKATKDRNEIKFKGTAYYGAEDRKMNAQKYYALTRYDRRFFDSRKFFGFISNEFDRDRFANIESRFTPGAGVGYWFAEKEDFKLVAETELGYTRTNFRDNTSSTNELVVVPRAYIEFKVIGKSRLSEEIKIYPALSEPGDYRLFSETILKNPITEHLSLNLHLIDEYNSNPGSGSKKNDVRILTKVAYTFN